MLATALAPAKAGKTLSNTVSFGTVNATLLLTGEQTGGAFSLVETMMRPGTEPPYHIHEREDETFYIMEGHVTVLVDGVVHECKAGDAIFLPRGIPHTFRVRSAVARTIAVVTPSGFEKFFQAVGQPAVSFEAPLVPMADYAATSGRAAAAFGVRLADQQPEF